MYSSVPLSDLYCKAVNDPINLYLLIITFIDKENRQKADRNRAEKCAQELMAAEDREKKDREKRKTKKKRKKNKKKTLGENILPIKDDDIG